MKLPINCAHDAELAIGDLKPNPRNPNKHDKAQIDLLAKVIKHQGWRAPIVVSQQSGLIVAGHGRLLAAKQLGLTHVPVDFQDFATPEDEWAHLIADNRIAELAEIDKKVLSDIMLELDSGAFDMDLTGFDARSLEQLMTAFTDLPPELVEASQLVDKAGELQDKWRVERGNVFEAGKHRLICGDSSSNDLSTLFGPGRAALVFTSPPYNQDVQNFSKSGMHKETKWVDNTTIGSYDDNKPEAQYQDAQSAAVREWSKWLTDEASIFYNHKNRFRDKQCISPWIWLAKTGAKVRQEIIWAREGSVTQNARMFMPCDERIFWLYYGENFYFNDATEIKTWSSIWKISSQKDLEASVHGCAFPVELPRRGIAACSRPGEIVFEPYCGSGTTMVAAHQLDRICYGMEIEPKYCAVILERMSNLGLTPRLVTDARAAEPAPTPSGDDKRGKAVRPNRANRQKTPAAS